MSYRIKPNPDLDIFKQITEKIISNGGYCCCAIVKNEDTKCICKEFREKQEEGECHCGRFIKQYVPDA